MIDRAALREALLSCEAAIDGSLYIGNKHNFKTDEDTPIYDLELLDTHVIPHVYDEYVQAVRRSMN